MIFQKQVLQLCKCTKKEKKETKVVANASSSIISPIWSPIRKERNRKIVRNVPLEHWQEHRERGGFTRRWEISYNGTSQLYACNHDSCNGKIRNYGRSCSSKLIISTMYERPYRLFVYPTRAHNRRWRGHLSIARLLSLYDFQIFTSEILAAKHIVPPPRFLQTAKPGKQSRINRISVTLPFFFFFFFFFPFLDWSGRRKNNQFPVWYRSFIISFLPLENWFILESISLHHFVF